MTQRGEFSWGALRFVDPEIDPPEDGYLFHAIADGTTLGNPEADYEVVQSLLRDGALAVRGRRKNRTQVFRLACSAPSAIAGPALAAGEKALMDQVQMDSPPPLIYEPIATDAVPGAFDVVVAEDPEWDTSDGWDLDESKRGVRYYTLTLTVLPFVRGLEKVVVPAIAVPPDPGGAAVFVNLDTCDATTNWSFSDADPASKFSGALGITSGAVRVTETNTNPFYATVYPGMTLVRTGALSVSGNPYLAVDVQSSHPSAHGVPTVTIDGVAKAPLAAEPTAGGRTRIYVATGDFSTLSVSVPYVPAGPSASGARWLEVANVARTDTIGDKANSTLRQQSRTATVAGSAPTQASIRLYDATPAPLGGEILVHTSSNLGWRPSLRGWLDSSAPVTADAARVSGGRHTLGTPSVFLFPASTITEGTYSLMALMSVTAGAPLGWSARMVDSTGAATVGSSVVISDSVDLPTTTGYELLNLAAIPLPVLRAEADQMIELTLTGTANMSLDEGLLMGLHDGVVTWLTDTDSMSWIEIRSPELGAARPSVFGGTGAFGTGSVCVDWKCGSFGSHEFNPGLVQIYTLAASSLVSQSEIEYYERNHSHMTGSAA